MFNFLDLQFRNQSTIISFYCIRGNYFKFFYCTEGGPSDVSSSVERNKTTDVERNKTSEESDTMSIDIFWNEVYSSMTVSREDSSTALYNNEVIDLLNGCRGEYIRIMKDIKRYNRSEHKILIRESLSDFQRYIEDLTMSFNINNLYKQYHPLIRLLTRNSLGEELQPARDFLKEKQCGLSEDELKALNGDHNINTIEALIVYVFANLLSKQIFEGDPRVKLALLIQHLDDAIRTHYHLAPSNKKIIGRNLIRFLVDREFITIVSVSMNFKNTNKHNAPKKVNYPCVECNFSLKLLPLRMNLPMIVPPRNWYINSKRLQEGGDIKLSELRGGYLTTNMDYRSFSLLTSRDINNFNIILKDAPALCSTLSNLQSIAFRVNESMLDYILHNRSLLESEGMLMDRRIAHVKMSDAYPVLKELYYKHRKHRAVWNQYKNLSDLELEFSKRVQQARFEDFILDIAKAYRGYEFYLPAFLDFRGRIYRTGLLHYHERDIAKSLIVFSNPIDQNPKLSNRQIKVLYSAAAAFKYKKHENYDMALLWYEKYVAPFIYNNSPSSSLIEFSKKASDPFQFLSKVVSYMDNLGYMTNLYATVPLSQDASASAYQIMSYFLLNADIGFLTNILPNNDNIIQDIYINILSRLRTFLMQEMPNVFPVIEPRLNRKLVKSIFMPLIYGKTVSSMIDDIKGNYGDILNYKECKLLATNCWIYFKMAYPDILSFMNMINNIGYICSYMDKAVIYDTDYFRTTQDYIQYNQEVLRVKIFNKESKKMEERKVTFQFQTSNRDSRKTAVSTCVNFIHQKDAYIAMKLIGKLFHNMKDKTSIYTVHDNFITPMSNSLNLSNIYKDIFDKDLPHPLILVNHFILINMRADLSEWDLNNPIINLKELIMNQVSNHHKKVDKKITKKIDETVKQYIDYVNIVTQPTLYEKYISLLSLDIACYSIHF